MEDIDGSAVEAMIAEGRKIVEDAIAEHRPCAVIAAFSGGNDSVVATHFAAENFAAGVLHCNTGTGLKKTGEHVHATAAKFGWDLVEGFADACRNGKPDDLDEAKDLPFGEWIDGDNAYEDFVLNYGFPGAAQHARMFQRLKERPIAEHVRRIRTPRSKQGPVMIISGIRHDESAIRAGYKRAVQKEEKNPRVWVNPFYWRTVGDFEMYRQEFSLPRNPVKALVGISGECNCGSFCKPGELEAIRSIEPEKAAYLERLTDRAKAIGFPWGWGEPVPKWWTQMLEDRRRGQGYAFDLYGGSDEGDGPFMPMCVGCPMGRR